MSKNFLNRKILKYIIPFFVVTTVAFVHQKKPVETSAWSGAQNSTAGNYYASVGSETGTALKAKLKSIISGASTSYDWSRYEAADEAEGKSDSVLLIYSRKVVKKTYHVNGNVGWNREHTWPQSKIGSPADKDNHHIFADDVKTNGARSNDKLGVVAQTAGNRVNDMDKQPTDNYSAGGYFMPNPAARGETARATMYLTTLYGYSITDNFQSVALMLQWHLENPVTNRDIFRNNTVHKLQKNRNPFVDHPEYACAIWGNENATTKSLCSNAPTVAVTGVSVTPTSGSVQVNGSITLTSSVSPANATNKAITWSSSNDSIASVSNGVVTGKAAGTATVTATSVGDTSKKASATITVTSAGVGQVPVTSVSLDKAAATLNVGETETLSATVLPANATNKGVTWSSGNNNVATVSNGVVTGISAGTATITATSNSDASKKASATITVEGEKVDVIAVTGVSLNKEQLTMNVGNSEALSAGVYPSNASDKSVKWESSDSEIAKVSEAGLVEAVGVGSATISVIANSDDTKRATATIKVTEDDVPVAGVNVNKKEVILEVTSTDKLNAEVLPSYATEKGVTWESSDASIATVNTTGLVRAIAFGSAKITVLTKDGNFKEFVYVTVRSVSTTSPTPYQKALGWSSTFLNATSEGCDTSDRELLSAAWNESQSSYNALDVEAQEIIKETPTGYTEGNSISHAKARYRIILNQYQFNDFIENTIVSNQELASESYPYYLVFIVFGLMLAFVVSGIIIYKSKKVKIA